MVSQNRGEKKVTVTARTIPRHLAENSVSGVLLKIWILGRNESGGNGSALITTIKKILNFGNESDSAICANPHYSQLHLFPVLVND